MNSSTNRDIVVAAVNGTRDLAEFMLFPWRVQRNDPCWVPPVLSEQMKILDRKSGAFFEFGEAEYFLAFDQGQPVGRISAHVNRRHEEHHDRQDGFFGFFECVDDTRVAHALFEAAAAWLRARGKTRILGPLSFTIYDEVGLLVEGFDTLPAFLQVHNPPYYQDLVTSWGFRKAIDWYALRIVRRLDDPEAVRRALLRIMDGQGLTMASYNPREVTRRAEEVLEIFNESWSDNWGHIPLTQAQFHDVFKQLRPLLRTNLIKLIMDGDRIAAFLITIPDLNPSIQKLDGRLTILDQVRLYYEGQFRPIRKLRTLLLGVRKQYQRRQLHHALILGSYLDIASEPTCQVVDCSLIPENLTFYLRALKKYGTERYKTFRIFEREI